MTISTMTLAELAEMGADADLLRQTMQFIDSAAHGDRRRGASTSVRCHGRYRELDEQIGASELEPFWPGFPYSLHRRGPRGVKLVTGDSHEGIKAAAPKVLKAT